MTTTIHLIAAARPNFMKIAPLYRALSTQKWANPLIIHTGQHYDINMSDIFFQDLSLPDPHLHLNTVGTTHAEQTGNVMIAYEKVLLSTPSDLTVVVGDVNSTAACTLVAAKLGIKTAHLEAGLRSNDRTMPEEINRVVTDSIADFLWTPSPDADANLIREGISPEKITRVGNIMIDSLEMMTQAIEKEKTRDSLGLAPGTYGVVTLHRPSNVDNPGILKILVETLISISKNISLVFPVHPRTRKQLQKIDLLKNLERCSGIIILEPLGYKSFMNLVFGCCLAITDSGGLQEETTYLGIPCFTLRPNTERPITVEQGTNLLSSPERLQKDIAHTDFTSVSKNHGIELWDGQTAGRVVAAIKRLCNI